MGEKGVLEGNSVYFANLNRSRGNEYGGKLRTPRWRKLIDKLKSEHVLKNARAFSLHAVPVLPLRKNLLVCEQGSLEIARPVKNSHVARGNSATLPTFLTAC